MMQLQSILIRDAIRNIESRPLDRSVIESLADSMNRFGLLNPITVYPTTYAARGRADNPGFGVIAGHHRLEAAKFLGWEEINAFVLDDVADMTTRRLIEISENLHRAELTALERGKLVAEWCELTGENLAQVEAVSGGRGRQSGQREAARQLGLDKEDVRRSIKVASLSPEAQAAAVETKLDNNQTALLTAAKAPTPKAQETVIRNWSRPAFNPAPDQDDEFIVVEKMVSAIMKPWNKASKEARAEFLKRIGER